MAVAIKAIKHLIANQIIGWEPHDDRRIVFYGLNHCGTVKTIDGLMERVRLFQRAEIANPDQDVAAHVGWIVQRDDQTSDGVWPDSIPHLAVRPELWFWGDHYWLKARACGKGDWYNNNSYLLYRVDVIEPDGFIERLTRERDQIFAFKQQ